MDATTIYVLTAVFAATVVRSAFGFGVALVLVPLLAQWLPVAAVAPLSSLISITVSGIVMFQDWDKVLVRSTIWLLVWGAIGIPLGTAALVHVNPTNVKAVLALLIIAFAIFSLLRPSPKEPKPEEIKWLPIFGFAAGILGGAFAMPGPPLIVYAAIRQWHPQRFRATLQAYMLPASVIALICYWRSGLWTATVNHYYLLSLPATIVAILLGREINRRIGQRSFLAYVYILLILLGGMLLFEAIRK